MPKTWNGNKIIPEFVSNKAELQKLSKEKQNK
jgi:hypothetical protein